MSPNDFRADQRVQQLQNAKVVELGASQQDKPRQSEHPGTFEEYNFFLVTC